MRSCGSRPMRSAAANRSPGSASSCGSPRRWSRRARSPAEFSRTDALMGCPAPMPAPDCSSSAMNRSTVARARSSSVRLSPTILLASCRARSPTSRCSDPTAESRSAWIWASARAATAAAAVSGLGLRGVDDLAALAVRGGADGRRLLGGRLELLGVGVPAACGLGLHDLGLLDAALDLLGALCGDLVEGRQHVLPEHDEQDHERDRAPQDVVRRRDERVRLLRRDDDDGVHGPS